jgi:ADP-heptose:LPS heptosyltransferase
MKISSINYGLGDTLILTSICKYFPNKLTVQLPPEKQKYSLLFSNLANVEICEKDKMTPLPDVGGGHYATRKLRNFFGEVADRLDNRPLVLYSDHESERWAFNFLKDKPRPVIVVPTCSKQWHHDRSMPLDLFNSVIEQCKKEKFTPIVCQSSDNALDHSEISLLDCDLKKYICLLRMVKEYVGVNTGDEHLATSVGCKTTVFQPNHSASFNRFEWNYNHPNSHYLFWHQ